MRVIITGGTGLIGRHLATQLLAAGHEVVVLTRNPQKAERLPPGARAQAWDAQTAEGWGALVNGDSAIVNLAGEPLLHLPFTEAHKRKVLESRLAAGRAVRQAIEQAAEKPRVLIQASAVGYYGNRGDELLSESAPPADDWFASVVVAWEKSTDGLPTRVVKVRTGIPLDPAGGAFQLLLLSARLFGGKLGNGKQWMSWLHIDDEAGAIRFLIEQEQAEGAFNLAAPNPVRNQEFVTTLAKVVGTRAIFPAPELALRIVLREMANTVLDSQQISPQKLLDLGYTFRFTALEPALHDLLSK